MRHLPANAHKCLISELFFYSPFLPKHAIEAASGRLGIDNINILVNILVRN